MAAQPKPTMHAAITCDQAIREEGTGKWTLVGAFTSIKALRKKGSPAHKSVRHNLMGIYFCVGNALGSYKIRIEIVKYEGTMKLIARAEGEVDCADKRHEKNDFAFNVGGLVLPGIGTYGARLFMSEKYIGETTFNVQDLEIEPPI